MASFGRFLTVKLRLKVNEAKQGNQETTGIESLKGVKCPRTWVADRMRRPAQIITLR